MSNPKSSRAPMAGGSLMAAGVMIGSVAGAAFGESSRGFLIGLGVGALAAFAIWWRERDR